MPNILPHTSSPATLHTQAKLTPDVTSVHLANELVDVGLAVAEVTTLNVVLELRLYPATVGVRELDGPEEVGGLLEVGANGEDFVDEVFHGEDVVFAKCLFDDTVAGKRNALLVDLAVSALCVMVSNLQGRACEV